MEKITKQDSSLVRLDTGEGLKKALKGAAECLLSGGLVAFPTESFYGLAVDATNEAAIRRLFSVKKRQAVRPVLILIPSSDVLDQYVKRIPLITHQLIGNFWPGALTLIFEAGSTVSPLLTAGTGKIGIRLSSHPIATALARAIGVPITGTSANISGKPACRKAEEVLRSFGEEVDFVLDGGETEGQIASTVLDITVHPPRILREGMVKKTELKKFSPTQ